MIRPGCLFLLFLTSTEARETVLKAERSDHLLVMRDVFLNGQGPFRMLVDTGAASCIIRPSVARRLNLQPAYAVEHVTVTGSTKVRASILRDLQVGDVHDTGVEILTAEVAFPGVDGVLGQSWLLLHDYLLDYYGHRLVLDSPAPRGRAWRTALRSSDGRPQIAAEVDGCHEELVIDSGASALVLFGKHPRLPGRATLTTNTGAAEVSTGPARLTIAGERSIRITAAILDHQDSPRPGLLPAALFRAIHISNREGVVTLLP
jgi:predicted aspartyl protease